MRFVSYGPITEDFEAELREGPFSHLSVSEKEREALTLVAKGYSVKQIADLLKISHSAVEKRIIPLYRRFDVYSLTPSELCI